MFLLDPCQRLNLIGRHTWSRIVWFRFRQNFGFRTQLRKTFGQTRLGDASRYSVGHWVRVQDQETIKRTLDTQSRLRGLLFLPYQWAYCRKVYRVQRVVRSLIDDEGIFRPVSRTILLEGVTCPSEPGEEGCGRDCPLMFRDEWVEPAEAPADVAPAPEVEPENGTVYVRVRSAQEIKASLDGNGKREGLLFMPEMYHWAGMRFRVARKISAVFE